MDDPHAEEIRTTLGKINRARMAQSFLHQAVVQLQHSGLLSWPEGPANITDHIVSDMIHAESDLERMITIAQQHAKTDVRNR